MTSETKPLSIPEEIARIKEPGLSAEQRARLYSEWASSGKYDEDVSKAGYNFPSLTAAAVADHLQGRQDVSIRIKRTRIWRILDVGAGSGRVAIQLRELGFTLIDALDGSEGMLEVARGKGLYQQYFCVLFEGKVDCIKTSSYDVIVSCASLGEHLIQWYMLGEMIRCVRTGGLIIIVFRESTLQTGEFKNHFEPYVKQLESECQWVLLERALIPGYINQRVLKFVFKVTK